MTTADAAAACKNRRFAVLIFTFAFLLSPLHFCLFTFALSYNPIRLHQRPLWDRQAYLLGGFEIDD